MKKLLLTILISLFFYSVNNAQPGMWTWMHGSNLPWPAGSYGTQGVASPTNSPFEFYEGSEWTDLNGNFWYYGGTTSIAGLMVSSLWKFDPIISMWTWVQGPNTTNSPPVHGTMGVPSAANSPGPRAFGAATWVDLQGNLWLFGGIGLAGDIYSDLWKYNIATNMWTWMHGPNTPLPPNSYGIQGVPSPLNYPPGKQEHNASWVDNNGNLWLFGGETNCGIINDLWRYDVGTNQWTWVRGFNTCGATGNYGTVGVASPTNEPPAGWHVYAKWKDNSGDFWFMGGDPTINPIPYTFNELWKYNVASNQWTCVRLSLANPVVSAACVSNTNNQPDGRFETRTCWVDNCGKFWFFGGFKDFLAASFVNDLWCYDPTTNEWTFVNGSPISSFGTQNVPAASNQPPALAGAVPYHHNDGSLWLFGGAGFAGHYNSMWRYVIDTNCVGGCVLSQNPVAGFTGTNLTGCASLTVNFTNTSANATGWNWNFGDGTTSTIQNPSHTYAAPGQYTVTLISSNATGSDTITSINYVSVFASANASFTSSGNSICLGQSINFTNTSTNGTGYLWNFGDGNTSTSTNPSHTYGASGNYTVSLIAQNANGCNDTLNLPITVNSFLSNTQNHTICSDSTYMLPDSTYTSVSGTYSDTLTAVGGCDSIITTNLIVNPTGTFTQNASICAGYTYTLPDFTVVSVAGTYYDTVPTSKGCDSAITTILTVKPNASSIKSATVCSNEGYVLSDGSIVNTSGIYNDSLQSSNSCDSVVTINLTVNPSPIAGISSDITITLGTSAVLLASGGGTYNWYPTTNLSCTNCANPTASPNETTTYCVEISSVNTCRDTACVTVNVEIPCPTVEQLKIPNAFSPNNDGVNDEFCLQGWNNCVEKFTVTIFNRWGEQVYESSNPDFCWNGTYNGKIMDAQVFVYYIKATFTNQDKVLIKKGNISLIR